MRRCLILLSLVGLLVAGCSKPEAAANSDPAVKKQEVVKPETAFVGKWSLDASKTNLTDEAAKSAASTVLEIKDDKTFAITSAGGLQNGTIEVNDKTATMTVADPKTDADKKPITGTLSDDGKSLKLTTPASADAVLYFVRQ